MYLYCSEKLNVSSLKIAGIQYKIIERSTMSYPMKYRSVNGLLPLSLRCVMVTCLTKADGVGVPGGREGKVRSWTQGVGVDEAKRLEESGRPKNIKPAICNGHLPYLWRVGSRTKWVGAWRCCYLFKTRKISQ